MALESPNYFNLPYHIQLYIVIFDIQSNNLFDSKTYMHISLFSDQPCETVYMFNVWQEITWFHFPSNKFHCYDYVNCKRGANHFIQWTIFCVLLSIEIYVPDPQKCNMCSCLISIHCCVFQVWIWSVAKANSWVSRMWDYALPRKDQETISNSKDALFWVFINFFYQIVHHTVVYLH